MELIFEQSVPGRRGFVNPRPDVDTEPQLPDRYRRQSALPLPEVSELDCVRHYTRLAQRNYSVDTNFYPLGSCTMKYNPRFTEELAAMPGFQDLHPLLPQLRHGEQYVQGALAVLYDMERLLSEITGMDAFTLQPMAGAHGELTGVMMIAAYHKARGDKRRLILVPDSAHGTNPASAAIAGYETIAIPTTSEGVMDLECLRTQLTPDVAAVMMTCPNTLGIFNPDIDRIAAMVHEVGALMYYDGANLNALLGRCRPGDLGFDVMHINLHKTFATPHGGGGPGSGPVGVKEALIPYLPISRVVQRRDATYALDYDYPDSIGYIAPFYGNFGIILRAYAYIRMLGADGLRETSTHAVLNANYILSSLRDVLPLGYDRPCMHECVFTAAALARQGVHAIDLAKYLMEQGTHPPTVYFPLIVKEAIMVEPTETESRQAMDAFIAQVRDAVRLAEQDPERLRACPRGMPISRPDEAKAGREVRVNYFMPCV